MKEKLNKKSKEGSDKRFSYNDTALCNSAAWTMYPFMVAVVDKDSFIERVSQIAREIMDLPDYQKAREAYQNERSDYCEHMSKQE